MCRATIGAPPVWACTWAASAIFSFGSRGTPGWENTLNRVPELPKAQEGTSMVCLARASRTCAPAVEVMSAATPNIGRRIPRIDSETIHLGSRLRAFGLLVKAEGYRDAAPALSGTHQANRDVHQVGISRSEMHSGHTVTSNG